MNITFYKMNNEYSNLHSTPVRQEKTKPSDADQRASYDKLTISSSKTRTAAGETAFAKLLTREIVSRLDEGADSERLLRLSQQVSDGTYIPDSRRIAEHMLGYRS